MLSKALAPLPKVKSNSLVPIPFLTGCPCASNLVVPSALVSKLLQFFCTCPRISACLFIEVLLALPNATTPWVLFWSLTPKVPKEFLFILAN